jgi:tetratricopeptide (TPR) repeat protein
MNPQLQRALLLFEQNRYEMAEAELRQVLVMDPHDPYAHAILALCLAHRDQVNEATEEARQAIHVAPDFAFAHYALAWTLHQRHRGSEALAAVREAVRLDPENADYHALEAQVHLDAKHWPEALAAAERGLQLDSEHVSCTNLRAIALVKLGRKAEAGATIDAALRRNPDNAITHANQGWACLEQSEPRKALEHFREALRLDPGNEWARAGLVEALKARNVIYGMMLRYFLWMSKLPTGVQFGVVIGGVLLNRMLGAAATANPALAPLVLPIRILYLTLVLLTWTADPLFNLLLRLNKFGRLALTDEQRRASSWFAAVVIPALLSLALCFYFGFGSIFVLGALVFGFLMIPVSGSFKASEGWPRTLLICCTLALAAAGFAALGMLAFGAAQGAGGAGKEWVNRGTSLLGLFVLGCVIFMWGANAIIPIRPKR